MAMQRQNLFYPGLLVGAVLSGLLVLSFTWPRIIETETFADQNMRIAFAAMDDITEAHDRCGDPCQDQQLKYVEMMRQFGYDVAQSDVEPKGWGYTQ